MGRPVLLGIHWGRVGRPGIRIKVDFITLHYMSCHLADAFIQSDFQLSAFNLEGANSRQQVVSASTLGTVSTVGAVAAGAAGFTYRSIENWLISGCITE